MTGGSWLAPCRRPIRGLPVVLVSGFAVEVSPEELEASGVHAVLAKPINIKEVLGVAAALRPRSV